MYRILVVDDERELSMRLSEFLQNEGFSVVCAEGQSDGLEAFGKNEFDCILIDISLKDGNGFSVCSAVRAQSDVPVIFLTASGDESCTVAGFEIGADDYIAKPFRPPRACGKDKKLYQT